MDKSQEKTHHEIFALRNDLLRSNKLFEDNSFPLHAPGSKIKWLRPREICKNPQLIVEEISRFDVNQGALGNCWFMAAIDCLARHKQLFYEVVRETNSSFTDGAYCGLFHFRFWYFGSWTNVIIDDRLPTRDKKLVFVTSKSENEFWPALLEKAYAKLYGGYEKLEGGHVTEGLADLTGGVTEVYDLKDRPGYFYEMICKAFKRNTLMGAAKYNESRNIGLTAGHAYAITHITPVADVYGNHINLIRIRNPWGNEKEYTGDWSDSSMKWNIISIKEKQRIKWDPKGDGEFWMLFEDFLIHFDYLEICNLLPDLLTREPHSGRQWKFTSFREVWKKNGAIHHIFSAVDPDTDDNEEYCTVVLAVMSLRRNRNEKNRRIRLKITTPDDQTFQRISIPNDYNRREYVFRYDMVPGTYDLEILSYYNNDTFEYLFRIFYETKKDINHPLMLYQPLNTCKKACKSTENGNAKEMVYYSQKKYETRFCNIL